MIEHKSRVPGTGKANRKLITPEGGVAAFYAKVEFADDPIDAGQGVTKAMLDELLAASGTTTGTGSALLLAQSGFVLADGAPIRFKLHTSITGATAINVAGSGAKPLTYLSGNTNLVATPAGTWITAIYSATLDTFVIQADISVTNVTVDGIPATLKTSLTALSESKYDMALAADSTGNIYVAGGQTSSALSAVVEKYGANDAKTTLTSLGTVRSQFSGAGNGVGNVLFGGGYDGTGVSSVIEKYDASGVRSSFASLSFARMRGKSARLGNGHTLFFGGFANGYYYGNVDKIDTSGVRTALTNLTNGYILEAFGVDGNGNVIVGGGTYNEANPVADVDKYAPDGTKTSLTALSTARYSLAAATDGNGAVIFAGGRTASQAQSQLVEKYDKTGVKTTLTNLSQARYNLVGARINDGSVIFGGGVWYNSGVTTVTLIERYDLTGTRTTITPTITSPVAAENNAAGAAIFLGDAAGSYQSAMSKIYQGYATKSVNIPMYALYKFQEHATEQRAMSNPTAVTINTPNAGTIRFGGSLTL